jgi:hypothetical protein
VTDRQQTADQNKPEMQELDSSEEKKRSEMRERGRIEREEEQV